MKRNDGIIKFLLVLLFEPDYLEVRLLLTCWTAKYVYSESIFFTLHYQSVV